ncbi:hypothetical protein GE061_010430 [Apolygus lucorum]|uniref:Uncharacterized protein n=1 Tax=Apolygus lucorum TaxID=248454 RepID=A0A8S9XUT7_APOLU|nr:hypothetical protein GE061_010430 [Apolygus lucorum]
MLVNPQEVLIAHAMWITEQSSQYFLLQRRKGHGKDSGSLSSLFVGTIDSIFDSKPPPYRILHQTPTSDVYYTIACSVSHADILKDWKWLHENLECLPKFEREEDLSDFVCCKVKSMVAISGPLAATDEEGAILAWRSFITYINEIRQNASKYLEIRHYVLRSLAMFFVIIP